MHERASSTTLPGHDVVNPAGTRTLVFAHGILGSRNNWKGFARRLVQQAPDACCVLVDLRHHGDSHGFAPPDTIGACADDVDALLRALDRRPDVLVGHSFGGKVMLALALRESSTASSVWSLDSPPGVRTFGEAREAIDRVVDAVGAEPMPVVDRKTLVEHLRARDLPEPIAQWMTTNLRAADDGAGFVWRFALPRIGPLLSSFGALDLWPALEAHRPSLVVHIVRGGRSDRWSPEERAHLLRDVARGIVREHVLPDAGHWVHTDDPDGLLALLLPDARGDLPGDVDEATG